MTAYVAPTPAPFQRYFGLTADPNSSQGGSNRDAVNGGDTTNFAGSVIPDVTKAVPVTTADHAWSPTMIDRSAEVTAFRAARPNIPFKVSPQLTFTVDGYRWTLEKLLKYVMGAEAVSGTGPYVHTLTPAPFGTAQLPTLIAQLVRDGINHKCSGVVLESVDLTFGTDGTSSCVVEAHPLYTQIVSTAPPTPVATEPDALPLVIRDAQVVFDSGATSAIGISQFTFGFKNNNSYDRTFAGQCIDLKTVGATPINRQLWFPTYHRLSARQTVTFGLTFMDTVQTQEIAAQWGQIQKIQVTIAEPNVSGNQIVWTLNATEIGDGGVDALTATGSQTSAFTGNAYYSSSAGNDVSVAITNATATPIA